MTLLPSRIAATILRQSQASSLFLRNSSGFVAPVRPKLKISEKEGSNVEGREDQSVFCSDYVPPQKYVEKHMNHLKNKLERMDCLRRRQVLDIPEFYAGSVIRVTMADKYGQDNVSKFVGRVLYRDGFALNTRFLVRNIYNGEGCEKMFYLYAPNLLAIEVLRLEKWMDTDLRYLRDAEPKWCTIDHDMTPEAPTPVTEDIPVFKDKVKLVTFRKRWAFKYDKSWPRPYNAFFEEHLVEEEYGERNRIRKKQSHFGVDICRHYDVRKIKPKIMAEMKANRSRIRKATSAKTTSVIDAENLKAVERPEDVASATQEITA